MGSIIIVIILIAAIIFAVKGSFKHMAGQGGCCGGGGTPKVSKKKLERPVIETKTYKIDGMHCENCRNRVEMAINGIEGAACKVNLSRHEAVVKFDRRVADALIMNAVEKAGYKVEK